MKRSKTIFIFVLAAPTYLYFLWNTKFGLELCEYHGSNQVMYQSSPSRKDPHHVRDLTYIDCLDDMCYAQNICFDSADQMFVILVPEGHLFTRQHEKLMTSILGRPEATHLRFSGFAKQENDPSKYRSVPIHDEVYSLQYIQQGIVNHGHVFGDHVVTLFQALWHFGLQDRIASTKIVLVGDEANRKIHHKQFGIVFDQPPLNRTFLAQKEGTFCFRHLLLAGGTWGYADSRGRPVSPLMLVLLRQYILNRFDISEKDIFPSGGDSELRVKVPVKDLLVAEHPSHITNLIDISKFISSTYQILPLETVILSNLSVREMVYMYATSHVMIAQPGSDIMMTFLMPDDATLCVVNRMVNGTLQKSNEISLWLQFLPRVLVLDIGDETWADPTDPLYGTKVPLQPLNSNCLAPAFSRWTHKIIQVPTHSD